MKLYAADSASTSQRISRPASNSRRFTILREVVCSGAADNPGLLTSWLRGGERYLRNLMFSSRVAVARVTVSLMNDEIASRLLPERLKLRCLF
jgi:hypothetical protein